MHKTEFDGIFYPVSMLFSLHYYMCGKVKKGEIEINRESDEKKKMDWCIRRFIFPSKLDDAITRKHIHSTAIQDECAIVCIWSEKVQYGKRRQADVYATLLQCNVHVYNGSDLIPTASNEDIAADDEDAKMVKNTYRTCIMHRNWILK